MRTGHWAGWVVMGVIGAAGCGHAAGKTGSSAGSCPPPEPMSHRASASTCPLNPSTMTCSTDADCPNGPTLGKCLGGLCDFDPCTTDADCGSGDGGVCTCQGQDNWGSGGYIARPSSTGNVCNGGNCRVDADCGAGFFCSLSTGNDVVPVGGFYCHTCADECTNQSDCPALSVCAFHPSWGHWYCLLNDPNAP